MLDKILGVSPTQKGLAQDSKVADQKNLKPDFKKDFERQLQKKLDTKSNSSNENVKDSKAPTPKSAQEIKKSEDELRADHKEKKPSGGIKKKMVEPDEETMISNGMALPKNEFEIPDEKINLATIESDGSSEKKEITGATVLAEKKPQAQSLELVDNSLSQKLIAVDSSKLQLAQPPQGTSLEALPEAATVVNPQEETQASVKNISLEEQLSQDVGFESDLKQHVADAGLVQKMKEFESEKGLTPEKSQDFEQKVLEQLQQEKATLVSPHSETKQNGSDSFSQKEQAKDSLSELQVDKLRPDSNLHSGQMHTDFKAHLSSPLEKAGTPTAMSQLLDKREENVQEVMKQAKYLAIKGGGEMTVKMSPEGMGEIQLKVLMQDGKLSIDMQTHDKSVKKLIEDSLSELKSGLAAQQVHVEHVKISSVNATNTDNSAQFHSNQDQAGTNQQQKDFWKNFQENFGNQSRRSSYGDVASVKSPTSGEPAALQPIKTNGFRSYGRTGSTINRVA